MSPKKCRKLSGRSPKKRRSKRPQNPKRLENCPGGAQKGPETVREEPKKTQKLEGFKKAQKLSGSPNKHETVQEEPKKAQKLSGRI